jgi:transposase
MEKHAYLGIDVSKGYADFVLMNQYKVTLEESFQLQDNKEGRSQLREIIDNWFSRGIETLYCGVESTGGYENNWFNFLRGMSLVMDVKVARLNAKGVKALSDAALKRTITDTVSAENIAVYLISFSDKVKYCQPDLMEETPFKEGRQHFSFIRMLIKQKVQLSNQLEKLIYQYFPEMMVYCRNGIPSWLLRMLSRYSCASEVARAKEKKLTAIKGISLEKARALISKVTRAEGQVSKHIQHVISSTCKELLHKEEMVKEEKEYLKERFGGEALVKLLITIPGVAVETAVLLLLEIENPDRFDSAKKMAAYFGVHPIYKQSGDGMWKAGLSKKGRGELRAALYMAGLAAVRFNPIIKATYARFRAKGMKHYQAMGVVMHKLLRIIFGILKTKTGFDAQVDQNNIAKSAEKQKTRAGATKQLNKEKEERKHRFQQRTAAAPVSRMTAKKIKQVASQASIKEENTGLLPAS